MARTRADVYRESNARLSEAQLQRLLRAFDTRMERLNNQYLRAMGEHIKEIGEMWPSDVHRLQQIRRMNRNLARLERQIAKEAEASVKDIERIFKRCAESDIRMAQRILGTPDIGRVRDNPYLWRILEAQSRETAGTMRNLSNTTVVSSYYRAAVDEAVTAVQSGVEDYNTAIRRVIREAGQNGLRITDDGVTKVDYESGYSRRLDSAARMNVLDGVRHLNQNIMNALGEQFGANGIEIDAHMLCAEDHLPYQGLQFTLAEFEEIQMSLRRPFGEWNCRHSWHPILIGISPRNYSDEQLEMMKTYSRELITIDGKEKTRYEWSQEMRRIETAIRRQKDTANLARATGDTKLRERCQGTVIRLNQYYDQVSHESGLNPEYRRTFVAGFKDVKFTDSLTNTSNSGTMNIGYFRELNVAHSMNELKIPVTLESVYDVMKYAGDCAKLYDGVSITVDASEELMRHQLFGWTSPDGKEVQFYANAFLNAENLAVTIAHESKHLQQVLDRGLALDTSELGLREREALAYEDEWWKDNGERIIKAYENTDWI